VAVEKTKGGGRKKFRRKEISSLPFFLLSPQLFFFPFISFFLFFFYHSLFFCSFFFSFLSPQAYLFEKLFPFKPKKQKNKIFSCFVFSPSLSIFLSPSFEVKEEKIQSGL
jgi:hypothetical protein